MNIKTNFESYIYIEKKTDLNEKLKDRKRDRERQRERKRQAERERKKRQRERKHFTMILQRYYLMRNLYFPDIFIYSDGETDKMN